MQAAASSRSDIGSKRSVSWDSLSTDQKELLRSLMRGLEEEGVVEIHKNMLRREISVTKISTNLFRCLANACPHSVKLNDIIYQDTLDHLTIINPDRLKSLVDRV